MARTLELTQLRSFVAVADCGGFHRAANALHVSQPTVSHHIRRLEATIGQPLMVREGRTSRLTAAGEMLLADARRMLEIHDEAMRRIGNAPETDEVVVGSTEHAADQLLPELASALQASLGVARIRFRLDRGAVLRTALDRGDVDLALLFGAPDDDRSTGSGRLTLRWYSAPGWAPPTDGTAIPLVAFDEPCAIRNRALETLAAHHTPAAVVCDAAYLGGVLAAARAGLGVALLATVGRTPEGLVERDDLPVAEPIALAVRSRRGLRRELAVEAARSIRQVLDVAG
ncbi:transcriptional regulator, LysR family [Pseudonocardia dioxanivorans CB1190]|uniref:Transcriptional regulator, LysR family n=1 Tax=Pseudonocardia dioxanivorans (strain ATCC 55486 / DSM 44775 / JCM 13855 / CB1190) TaxID=675635 RepID=F4CMJ4_PSEUX|nr:LysR family transcriptional regulator [Pseudonocardia dioxanivorans]AEA23978.1 transcriptional regulator, LysR family [Pseudonocardia dioxanivorans CB1190]